MADEISVNVAFTCTNGGYKHAFAPGALTFDQAAQGAHSGIVIVGQAAEEDLAIGDISTEGWLVLRNLDATNYVTYGPKDTTMTAFGRIEAGEVAVLRMEPGVTLRWQANTADVKVQVILLED